MALDSPRGKLAIMYEIGKKKYVDMVFAKNPPMIKLGQNSVEVYYKRIRLGSGFWNQNCVYLMDPFPSHFIVTLALMSNKSLHSFYVHYVFVTIAPSITLWHKSLL